MDEVDIEILSCHSPEIGMGHRVRSEALASHLGARGFRVKHLKSKRDLHMAKPVSQVRIFDCPENISGQLRESADKGVRTVGLDYGFSPPPDIVISVMEHVVPLPPGERYSGFQFAIVREEIRREVPRDLGYVVVVLGGADFRKIGPSVASQLAHGLAEEVILVQGALTEPHSGPSNYRTETNPTNFAQILAGADWVVCNGGGTLFEAMSLGKAAFVVPQTQKEQRIAATLKDLGAVIGFGELLDGQVSLDTKARVGASAKQVIDGRGVERIGDLVESIFR